MDFVKTLLTFVTKQTYCDKLSQTPITLKQARAIASAHFNQSPATFSELSDGFFNSTYRLNLADGTVRVLKATLLGEVRVLCYENPQARCSTTCTCI